jgi:tRNA-2-methylthio-N6-dimethylallyladenosine synthase
MNVHDSERMTGMLEGMGLQAATDGPADVIVINTCAVRENADMKLYGYLGQLRELMLERPHTQIAVGGCLAQKDQGEIIKRAPWVSVVFGTNNLNALPILLERARIEHESQIEIVEALEVFPSHLPTKRDHSYSAWVSISVGCNNTCTFCIVPSLRGKEKDRRPGEILEEIEMLVADGVSEITLLGQNVNSYGAEFGDREAFSKLLRACGDIKDLERVRFTSPHPKEFSIDVLHAMRDTHNVMPSLHMPMQSGSDAVLQAMRRSYRQEKYLTIIEDARRLIPNAAITTDIIVGFPGETEKDFQETLKVVELARFAKAYTYQYSKRPGTPAATMENQIPQDVVTERFDRLVELGNSIAWSENKKLIGEQVEVLIADGEGKKDGETQRISGRARDNRLVHIAKPGVRVRPGDVATAVVTYAAPFHLIADSNVTVRQTRAGDKAESGSESGNSGLISIKPRVGNQVGQGV